MTNRTEYARFRELVEELYPECTLEQQLGVYVQHRPASVVPFLLELIRRIGKLEGQLADSANMILELHPDTKDPDDQTTDTD